MYKETPEWIQQLQAGVDDSYYGYLYTTHNSANGKVYVGQHKGKYNPKYLGSGTRLSCAIKKYGKDKFVCNPLFWIKEKEDLDYLEKSYIENAKEFYGKENVYNIAVGGEGVSSNAISGNKNGRYIDGRSSKEYFCSCGNKMYKSSKQCKDCEHKSRAGDGNSAFGKKLISNAKTDEHIFVLPSEVDLYKSNGWTLGMSEKRKSNIDRSGDKNPNFGRHLSKDIKDRIGNTLRKRLKGTKIIYNLTTNKESRINPQDVDEYLKTGWALGYNETHKKNLQKPKNPDSIRKAVDTRRKNGSYASENNPMYGRHHSKETREKQRLRKLGLKYVYNDDGVVRRIQPQLVDGYLCDGWKLGRGKRKCKD